jgi:hypothetical protein
MTYFLKKLPGRPYDVSCRVTLLIHLFIGTKPRSWKLNKKPLHEDDENCALPKNPKTPSEKIFGYSASSKILQLEAPAPSTANQIMPLTGSESEESSTVTGGFISALFLPAFSALI